jgi:outer membrane protein TolC
VRVHDLEIVAAEQLRILMDDPPEAQYAIGEDLLADLPAAAPAAARLRPEQAAAREGALALRDQARAARAATLPRLDLVGDVTAGNPNPRYLPPAEEWNTTWSVGVQLSWSLGDAPAAHKGAVALDHRRAAAERDREALDDAIRLEVAQAEQAVRDADALQDAARRGLAAAEESARVREALYREGLSTTTELLDADTELTRARLEAVNARIDARVARIRLEHATGR